ncbi:MAG: GNAT family N-acetyltransferase [Tissierellia bacterium]|nr:GNAT family N-acetyltransferase [Tissierellia bacterium]
MKHVGTKVLETSRLLLRPFEISDAPILYKNWGGDGQVTKYLRWPTHKNEEDSREIVELWMDRYRDPSFYQWAIVLKDLGENIGAISVVDHDDRVEMVHIGYCIGSRWWGQGITTEALGRVIQFFFEEVGIRRIESQHDPENIGSGKVMEKCGMIYEGTHRQSDWSNRGIVDAKIYGILRSDWFAQKDLSKKKG